MDINGNSGSNNRAARLNGRAANREYEQGGADLEVRVLKLDAIFGHIQSLLRQRTSNGTLPSRVDSENAPGWLKGNPGRLRQAMLNHALSVPRREVNRKGLAHRLEGQA